MTRNCISRSSVHGRIGGRQNSGATFCGGTYNAKGRKGGNHCCKGKKLSTKVQLKVQQTIEVHIMA